MSIDEILEKVKKYNTDEKDLKLIREAYVYARKLHKGQFRQSGEEYIIHPLEVANILVEFSADADTLAAAFLHDTIEDTNISKEDLENKFNIEIANLVDAVTKFGSVTYADTDELFAANHRKMLVAAGEDVRSILIKLADRLHNMRTLQYKSPYKQKEKSIETMEIYVPLAYYIGAYKFKDELENISFKYLKPRQYLELSQKVEKAKKEAKDSLDIMVKNIDETLTANDIPHSLRIMNKSIYGIYKKLDKVGKLTNIHNLFEITCVVEDVKSAYYALGLIHAKYLPLNNKFKDHIAQPKTNMYSALHTTVFR
ncbi:MAG: HD domain-containing protein [Clostridia bacterium]